MSMLSVVRPMARRARYALLIRAGRFRSDEPEFTRLGEWVRPGDCVLDVGANVGHYTLELARQVGPGGHVFAIEPVPDTFSMLVSNIRAAGVPNVTPLRLAASDGYGMTHMSMPNNDPYCSRIDSAGDIPAYRCPVDALNLPRIAFAKIDAERHEASVLRGMMALLDRDRPTILVEAERESVALLASLGYRVEPGAAGSPNRVAVPKTGR